MKPNKYTEYLTLEEVILLHERLTSRFGGDPGIRDKGQVEAALFRCRSGYYESLSEQAAALFQSLARNHSFVDGNKRAAFAATSIFIRLNGYKVKVKPFIAEKFIVDKIIKGHVDIDVISKWLEKYMVKI